MAPPRIHPHPPDPGARTPIEDDFGTPDRTWRTFSNHGGASAPSRIFLVGTIASKVLAKGNTWSTGGSRTTPSGDRIGRGTPGRIASRGFPARVGPSAWKATWPAQNKPTRPSIFSLIHNSYQGEFLIRTWQLLTIHVHARMIYLTKPLEFISACSHSTCTMHMPALSTAIMNHCMLLRTNRQDAARSKPSITHELLPIKDKMLPRRPPAKESAAEGLPEDIATYGATPARAMHSDNYTGACIDTHETFSCRAMQTPSLDN